MRAGLLLLLVGCAEVWQLPSVADSGLHTDPLPSTEGSDVVASPTTSPGDALSVGGLCAGGGYARNDQVAVLSCTAPVSVAGTVSTNGTLMWEPGPISWVTPQQ